jgi:outer membrane protein insertion porin family
MGGETDIRGYDIRAISPVTFIPEQTAQTITYHDPTSGGALRSFTVPVLTYVATLPGGDLQSYGNVEYRIPIVGTIVGANLFVDAGTDGILRRSALQLNPSGFNNLTTIFPTAQQNAGLSPNLPIASGTNFRMRYSTGIEFVVQIPIIQAPFRIYYAYNLHRLYQELVPQQPFIEPSEKLSLQNSFNAIDPTIYPQQIAPQLNFIQNNPGRLNYFEPKTTFRFTVGRTF